MILRIKTEKQPVVLYETLLVSRIKNYPKNCKVIKTLVLNCPSTQGAAVLTPWLYRSISLLHTARVQTRGVPAGDSVNLQSTMQQPVVRCDMMQEAMMQWQCNSKL